jgi:predicted transcriptional regulator
MFKDEILKNKRRQELYSFIKTNPGIHQRELQRRLKMPLASLEYHLQYMKRRKVIFEEKEGNYARYYCNPLEPEDKRILLALRHGKLREIVLLTLVKKKASYQDFLESFKLPRSTIYLYLKHLVDNQIIEKTKVGYENFYTVKDEDRIAKVLMAYRSSFLDRLLDSATNIWLDTRFDGEKP